MYKPCKWDFNYQPPSTGEGILTGFLMKQHQFLTIHPSTSSPFRGAFPPASFTVTQPSRGPIPCCKRYPEPAAEAVDRCRFQIVWIFFWRKELHLEFLCFAPQKPNGSERNLKNIPQKDIWRKISSLVVFSVTLQGRFLQSKLLDLT